MDPGTVARVRELVTSIVVDRRGSVALRPITKELRVFLINSRLGSLRGDGARWLHGFGIALNEAGDYEVCDRARWRSPVTRWSHDCCRETVSRVVSSLVLPFVARERRAGVVWEFAGLNAAPRRAGLTLAEGVVFRGGFDTRLEALESLHEFLACGVRRAVGPYMSRFRPTARDVVDEVWASLPRGTFRASELAFNYHALRHVRRNPFPSFRVACLPGPSMGLAEELSGVLDRSEATGLFVMHCRVDDAMLELARLCAHRLCRYSGDVTRALYDVAECVEGHERSRLFSHPDVTCLPATEM